MNLSEHELSFEEISKIIIKYIAENKDDISLKKVINGLKFLYQQGWEDGMSEAIEMEHLNYKFKEKYK